MEQASDLMAFRSGRTFIILVGGTVQRRSSICSAGLGDQLYIEPLNDAGEIGLRDLVKVDVLLVWDEGEAIEQLKGQLSIVGCWCPIAAISESRSIRLPRLER